MMIQGESYHLYHANHKLLKDRAANRPSKDKAANRKLLMDRAANSNLLKDRAANSNLLKDRAANHARKYYFKVPD